MTLEFSSYPVLTEGLSSEALNANIQYLVETSNKHQAIADLAMDQAMSIVAVLNQRKG